MRAGSWGAGTLAILLFAVVITMSLFFLKLVFFEGCPSPLMLITDSPPFSIVYIPQQPRDASADHGLPIGAIYRVSHGIGPTLFFAILSVSTLPKFKNLVSVKKFRKFAIR